MECLFQQMRWSCMATYFLLHFDIIQHACQRGQKCVSIIIQANIQYHNKRPMGHIAYLRNSSNQKSHLRKEIIKLIKKKKPIVYFLGIKWSLFVKTWFPFTKSGWNWSCDSGFVDFINVFSLFHYYQSPLKRAGPLFEETWIPLTH